MKTASSNHHLTLKRPYCSQCVRLQEEVRHLREENQRLKAQLRYQQRKMDEGYFGSSTPSSQKPFKANTKAEHNNGGGQPGHRGHGRTVLDEQQADEVIAIDTEDSCLSACGHLPTATQ